MEEAAMKRRACILGWMTGYPNSKRKQESASFISELLVHDVGHIGKL